MPRNESFEPIAATLKKAAGALHHADIPFLLGGSIACWARGGPESSHDVDLMVRPDDAERALDALVDAGMRAEQTPEEWLLKAWDGDVLVDVIFRPEALEVDDDVLARGDELSVCGQTIPVMALEDVLTTKLHALSEHSLDYEPLVQIARSLREQIDWDSLRRRTNDSPYARGFFTLAESLGLAPAEGEGGPARVAANGSRRSGSG